MKQIVVITEQMDGSAHSITNELMVAARTIAAITGDEIVMLRMKSDAPPDAEHQKEALVSILKGGEVYPAFVVMGHTPNGMDVAPRLSVRLSAECLSGVNEIRNHQGEAAFVRSLFKGKFNGVLMQDKVSAEQLHMRNKHHKPLVLTIQPGSFRADGVDADCKRAKDLDSVRCLEIDLSDSSRCEVHEIRYGGIVPSGRGVSKLDQAKIIVAAGRGIKAEENLESIQQLVTCFCDASIAGSRPLIDMGWMPYAQQVGITGAVVSPELYLAIGISGSSQHLAGMAQSKCIVAVNNDPNAAIFNVSDICIVEDALVFVDKLVEKLKEDAVGE